METINLCFLSASEVKVIPQELEVAEVDERSFTLRWQCEDASRYTFLVCVRRVDGNDNCQERLVISVLFYCVVGLFLLKLAWK